MQNPAKMWKNTSVIRIVNKQSACTQPTNQSLCALTTSHIGSYTPAPPKVERGYTGFTLMSVRPSVRPSVRLYESTCIGYYLCTLNTNWIHFVYWIYPTIQCVEHVYIGYLRVITQNTHLVTDAAHVSVKWPSILCPLYWLHTARFFLWWPVGQSEMVAS